MNSSIMLLAAALLLAGCGERFVQKPHDGLRIIAIAPNTAEILYALGLSNQVVGVSRFCSYPPDVTNKPSVGGIYDPNFEMIVALQPDLVVGLETQKDIESQLKQLGIPFLGVAHEHISEILQSILTIGRACGAEPQAQQLFQTLKTKIGQASSLSAAAEPNNSEQAGSLSYVRPGLRGQSYKLMINEKTLNYRTDPSGDPSGASLRRRGFQPRSHEHGLSQNQTRLEASSTNLPRVLVCVGHDESLSRMYIAAKETFYDELIELAGGVNACERSGGYPEISPEGLAVMNPDVIINILPNPGKTLPDFSKVWKPRRTVTLTNDYASIPGPRFVLLLEDFIAATQPENGSK